MNFSNLDLDPSIQKAIEVCGYKNPTPVQEKSIPVIMEGKDVVVSAQTGTGKTAAFVLPALHHLLQSDTKTKKARILILTPTRELATQITKAATLYGKFCRFNITSLVGGASYHHQIRDLQRGADIIVATPGRLMDHIEQKRVDLSEINMLVLDEADRMCDMGFIDDVQYIAKLTPSARQTLLFSATVDKQLTTVVRHLLRDPVRIALSEDTVTAAKVEQLFYKANSPHHKMRLLKELLSEGNMFKAIIFSSTKVNADRLADQLCADGFSAAALHGDLRQNARTRTLENFRRGKVQFVVATDVASRGIDIHDITHVINYDLPKFCEDYVHRIGRTGRAGKEGIAISFVLPSDLRHVKSIERFIGQRIQLKSSPGTPNSQEYQESDAFASQNTRPERPRQHKSEGGFGQRFKKKTFPSKRDAANPYSSGNTDDSFPYADERKKSFGGGKRGSFSENGNSRRKPFNNEVRESYTGSDTRRRKPFDGEKRTSYASTGESRRKPFDGEKRKSYSSEGSTSRRKPFDGERRTSYSSESAPRRKPFDGERRTSYSSDGASRRKPFNGEKRTSYSAEGRPARRDNDNSRPFTKRAPKAGRPFEKRQRHAVTDGKIS